MMQITITIKPFMCKRIRIIYAYTTCELILFFNKNLLGKKL